MLKTGQKAPDFTLPDQDGNATSLSALLADGPLILYFYPADFTPGCTREACNIRDLQDDLTGAGLRVVGVSPQDEASHQRFRAKHKLTFPLLADTGKEVIRAYDVDGPMGFGVRRATFLIGADGVVQDAVMADIRIDRHDQFIRAAIAAGATA